MTNTNTNTKQSVLNAIEANLNNVHTRIGTYQFALLLGLTIPRGADKQAHIAGILAELSTDPSYCKKLMVLVKADRTFVADSARRVRRSDAE